MYVRSIVVYKMDDGQLQLSKRYMYADTLLKSIQIQQAKKVKLAVSHDVYILSWLYVTQESDMQDATNGQTGTVQGYMLQAWPIWSTTPLQKR